MIGVGVTVGVLVAIGVAARGVAVDRAVAVAVATRATGDCGAVAVGRGVGVIMRPQPARIQNSDTSNQRDLMLIGSNCTTNQGRR
jgi:hypothetical protein